MAFADSKDVLIQSVVRDWFIRSRSGSVAVNGVDEIYDEWDNIVIQRWWRTCSVDNGLPVLGKTTLELTFNT